MKTEDVWMAEIVLKPYLTLILFSVPQRQTQVCAVSPAMHITGLPQVPYNPPGTARSGALSLPKKSDLAVWTNRPWAQVVKFEKSKQGERQ